jgi:hypothetical protein
MTNEAKPAKPAKKAPKSSARRTRVDSAAAAVAALRPRAAIQPPKHMRLRPGDVAYWNSILTGRAREEWRACDLVLAVQLARTQADLAAETERLGVEGMVIASAKADGNPITNPRATICESLAKRQMALMRTLRMGGLAAGRRSALLPARQLERDADALLAQLDARDPAGLLAR